MSFESRRARKKMYATIDELAKSLFENNSLDLNLLKEHIQIEIAGDPEMLSAWAEDMASTLVSTHDRAKRPRPGELFPDQAWVPVGDDRRGTVGGLSIPQLQIWRMIDEKEFAAQEAAQARKREMWSGWLARWMEPAHQHCRILRDLWISAYGWSPPPAPPPIIEPPTP